MTTNLQLKNAQPKDKDYVINVDTGLSLLIKKTGSKPMALYDFIGQIPTNQHERCQKQTTKLS